MASENEGDAVALGCGADVALFLSTERMIAGAKITDTMASIRSNAATIKIARATGESPLRVVAPGAARRTPATHAGGAGLPIVSAYRLTNETTAPCFTSTSPNSCR